MVGSLFGVYVHIPFCAHRCDYCAFAVWTDRHHLMGDYAAACRAELHRAAAEDPPATSVFFGGGTPSLLPADELVGILDAVRRRPEAEVTVECNPDDVTTELLATYRRAGVTRISLGVQSTAGAVLAGLGRIHEPAHVATAAAAVVDAGFATWSVDLIYGGPGESDADWLATVDAVLDLGAPHVSAYALTPEPGTALGRDSRRHPDDDTQAARYLTADAHLEAAGLAWYEVSNWARPGHESRHNRLYWAQGDYRGIGCAAHSHRQGHRWWNAPRPERYIAAIREGRSARVGEEWLDGEQRASEGLDLALRTRDGVPAAALTVDDPDLAGLVVQRSGRVVLTSRGRLLANEVALRLRPDCVGSAR